MSKLLSRDILSEILRLEERFREAVRNELSECDRETLLIAANEQHSRVHWPNGLAINMAETIIRYEAVRALWTKGKNTIKA